MTEKTEDKKAIAPVGYPGKPGLYAGISNKDYHNGRGVSSSGIKALLRSALHYKERAAFAETEPMRLGSAFHCLTLEPEKFDSEYVLDPGINRRTKAGKEVLAELEKDRMVIRPPAWDSIHRMRDGVMNHPLAEPFFSMGVAENSGYWIDKKTGRLCKIRPDWLATEHRVCLDLKSCEDAGPEAFPRACANFGYAYSAAFYLQGLWALGTPYDALYLVAVENKPPYAVQFHQFSDDNLNVAWEACEFALERLSMAMETGEWPGYPENINMLNLPPWAFQALTTARGEYD